MNHTDLQDNMLFELLKECKTLPNFLDQIFGFLQRRTDFYHIAKEPGGAVGLPEGLAEKLVRHCFYKWKPQMQRDEYSQEEIPISEEEIIVSNTEPESIVSGITGATEKIPINHDCQFSNSECYNGSKFPNYCWSQSIAEVDLVIKIPDNIPAKELLVTIHPSTISVKMKHDNNLIFNGELSQKCKANEAVWSIDKNKLLIHLDKCQEIWWKCLIKGEPEMDISKIDCSRPYDELSEEAQSKIEELQWNQERKKLGLPTSDELENYATLKKAWNVSGSPFSGPFDPSTVEFS